MLTLVFLHSVFDLSRGGRTSKQDA